MVRVVLGHKLGLLTKAIGRVTGKSLPVLSIAVRGHLRDKPAHFFFLQYIVVVFCCCSRGVASLVSAMLRFAASFVFLVSCDGWSAQVAFRAIFTVTIDEFVAAVIVHAIGVVQVGDLCLSDFLAKASLFISKCTVSVTRSQIPQSIVALILFLTRPVTGILLFFLFDKTVGKVVVVSIDC